MQVDKEDDSSPSDVDLFRGQIYVLASCRPDVMAPNQRKALVNEVRDALRDDERMRKVLSEWKDLRGSSLHAYRRIIPLFSLSLVLSTDNQERKDLLQTLSKLLELSRDSSLVQSTILELQQSSVTMTSTHQSSLVQTLAAELEDPVASSLYAVIPAIAIGSALSSGSESLTNSFWIRVLFKYSIDNFVTRDGLELAKGCIRLASAEDWRTIIAPSFVLKIKSHPDKVLDTVLGWIQFVPHPQLDDEWLSLLYKHVVSPKDVNRSLARSIFLAWASKDIESCARIVATLVQTQPLPTLAPSRVSIYELLEHLAGQVFDATQEPNKEMVQTALEGLLALLHKEAPKGDQQRLAGHRALIDWMVHGKQSGETVGYGKAIEYVRNPIVSKKTTEVGPMLGLLVERVHPEVLEGIAVDLGTIGDAKLYGSGLEALVVAASSKKSMHVEGLIALYLALLQVRSNGQNIPNFVISILEVGSSVKPGSFLYTQAMIDGLPTNALIGLVLPRCIALYTQITATREKPSKGSKDPMDKDLFPAGKVSAATEVLAACCLHPAGMVSALSSYDNRDQVAVMGLVASVECVLTYRPLAAEGLVRALFRRVNQTSLQADALVEGLNATREARETDKELPMKGQGSVNGAHRGFDASSVRRIARVLQRQYCSSNAGAQIVTRIMVLMHTGSTLRSEGHQRAALILNTVKTLQGILALVSGPNGDIQQIRSSIADEITLLSSSHSEFSGSENQASDDSSLSSTLHEAALSLLVSLGGIASNFSRSTDDPNTDDMLPYAFASGLCVDDLGERFSQRLRSSLEKVESLSETDMAIYLTPRGTLFDVTSSNQTTELKKSKRLSEEEEWELQIKKELEEKKSGRLTSGPDRVLCAEDQKLVDEQDVLRNSMRSLFHHFCRVLRSIEFLCSSDIEVGNECIPVVMNSVLAACSSACPALLQSVYLKSQGYLALLSLSSSVYEIDESHAPTVAQALLVTYRNDGNREVSPAGKVSSPRDHSLQVSALPSPCPAAACVVYEMDQIHDCLSVPSFLFLFPVIRAALLGPRTPPGCEAALRVLSRHTQLLRDGALDNRLKGLRYDMVVSILELLKHDRAQTFQDPTPCEALVECYNLGADPGSSPDQILSARDLSPLLDNRGAIGTKSCRSASMTVLRHLGELNKKLVISNPLVENRIWLNCFDKDDDVRQLARQAWLVHRDAADIDLSDDNLLPPPSPLYSAPLLPLLSHTDTALAVAASEAYATAMGKHPSTVSRSIVALCKSYIESFPESLGSDAVSTPASNQVQTKAVPPLRASLSQSLPTKPTLTAPKKKGPVVKSPLAIAGIGKPKVAKKKTVSSALLKPKEERTLDQGMFESQFKVGLPKEQAESKDSPVKVAVRSGVLRALAAMTTVSVPVTVDESTLVLVTSFLMAYGIAESDESLKSSARNALRDIVASKGGTERAIAFLLPHLETILKTGVADESSLGELPTDKVPRTVSASDRRKEGAVVALGSVALHLKGEDNENKIDSTIDMLMDALRTPSEDVQLSVADAMTKLMKKGRIQDRIESILSKLMNDCLQGSTLAVQRGAAYGLSAAVKGSGIATLKKFEIVKQLEGACTAGLANAKEGALFAIELLCDRLGLLFEPYVITLLPTLLKSFSDSSDHVRKAAANTVGMIMSKLSAHGVKLVMPAVLTAFNDPSWRTKQASILMLGAMSHLAPKQLASALPKVVPKLTEAFSDTHPKVKASAQEALLEISTVVRNPEISSISPILLKALTDPADCTIKALESLIETEFLHAIDAPSLALIVPILHRGLRERGATTKRFSGLIAGNITSMINDPKDFVPYIPTLLPDLQTCLLDPIPDVRSTSAKALGSLTRSLGDQILPELRPWLMAKLREVNCSSAERSGAAQGLTEVLIASGSIAVDATMRNEILPLRSHPEASTREGILWVLTFLPPALGQGFTPLIDASLPALINGLSDDSEPVRDVALRAGRVLIRSHGKVHADKILPSLEDGLQNPDYRIRVASLSLLGDLLSMIGGTTLVKGDGDTQDDLRKAERAQAQIALALGTDNRKRVLSGLYLARSDDIYAVRQIALQVWKTVVSVTGRTLRDILPVLVSKIIDDLASGSEERTAVAGRCLGDVVGKLGDSVLPQVIPVLRNSLYAGDQHTKRGVCVGLTEVINCSTKDQILRFLEIIVKVVQDALSDDDANVRKMAATSFQSLHSVVGSRAMDEVVPSLMVSLENGDPKTRHRALNGLTGILSVRSRELLPYIVPRLIQRPFTTDHAEALAGVALVTGSTLFFHFSSIIPALLTELADSNEEDEDSRVLSVRECSKTICRSVAQDGVNVLISEIVSKCGSDKSSLRRESCRMLEVLVTERAEMKDFYEQIPTILRELHYRLNDDNSGVLKATNLAFAALSRDVPAEELVKHVKFLRDLVASMVSDSRRRKGGVGDGEFLLPGFNMPKGLEPFLPIFQRGILHGSPDIREISAAGLGEFIALTSTKYLTGPLMIKMTGPLLRIVGDRNPSNVKVAILKTLGLILVKGGPSLKAFVPQFQTTFVKALADPSRQVRLEAIAALSLLMPLSTRVDPLIKELVTGSLGKGAAAVATGVDGAAAAAVQTATLEALAAVLAHGGDKAKLPATVPSALDAAAELLKGPDEGIRQAAAKVLGEACNLSSPDVVLDTIRQVVLEESRDGGSGGSSSSSSSPNVLHGRACAVRRILAAPVGSELDGTVLEELRRLCVSYISDHNDQPTVVREAGWVALGAVLGRWPDPTAGLARHQSDVLKVLQNPGETLELHRAVAKGLCVALSLVDDSSCRLETLGVTLVDACLQLALTASQRVQFAMYDVLWMALDVAATGNSNDGLDRYCSMSVFDNVRAMKSLHSKVLTKHKPVLLLD